MTLAVLVQSKFPNLVLSALTDKGDEGVCVRKEGLKGLAASLKSSPEFQFDMLMDIFAVDYLHWEEKEIRFEVIYNLYSSTKHHRLFLKVPVPETDAFLDSLVSVWPAADWFEREVWDMMGIVFKDHPNLKRLLMYEEFKGHPLRKDYPTNKRQPLVGPLGVFVLCLLSSVICSPAYAGSKDKSRMEAEHYPNALPQAGQDSFSAGVAYAKNGEWDKAIENLQKALALNPKSAEIFIDLSVAYAEKKDYDRALSYAQDAVRIAPRKANAYLTLGFAYESKGNLDKAAAAYQEGLKADAGHSDLYLALGNLEGRRGNLDAASKAYEKAIQADPKNTFAYSNIAYVYEKKGDMAKSIEYLRRASDMDPQDAVAWYDLGAAYAKQGDSQKSVEYYEKSYKLNPKFYKACLSLAMAYEKKRDLKKAAEYYVKAMALTDDPRLKEAILTQITRTGES